MAQTNAKHFGTPFKYVTEQHMSGKIYFRLTYPGYSRKCYPTAREAAIAIDKILIGLGKEPCNVLVRK